MNKTVIAVLAVVIAAVFFVVRLSGSSGYDVHSVEKIPHIMKCPSCGATSSYTVDELKAFVRAGKVVDVQYQARRFPCSKCGKIEAGFDMESKNAPPSKTQ